VLANFLLLVTLLALWQRRHSGTHWPKDVNREWRPGAEWQCRCNDQQPNGQTATRDQARNQTDDISLAEYKQLPIDRSLNSLRRPPLGATRGYEKPTGNKQQVTSYELSIRAIRAYELRQAPQYKYKPATSWFVTRGGQKQNRRTPMYLLKSDRPLAYGVVFLRLGGGVGCFSPAIDNYID
jgi:hypothetical protein